VVVVVFGRCDTAACKWVRASAGAQINGSGIALCRNRAAGFFALYVAALLIWLVFGFLL
jgi:hypothetical protein